MAERTIKIRIEPLETRLAELEKRIATLEGDTQKRQSQWNELVDGFEGVLINFCIDFNVPIPQKLKQKAKRL